MGWLGLGLGGVFLVSVLVVIYTRREVVGPLRNLVVASEQVQNRSLTYSWNNQPQWNGDIDPHI